MIIVTLRKLHSDKRDGNYNVIHEELLLFMSENKRLSVVFM